jgi:hypothetical protein
MGRRFREREEEYVTHEDVLFVRASARAVLVRWEGGRERWVPFTQMPPNFEFPDDGERGDLEITRWLDDRLDEDAAGGEREDDVSVPGVTAMRASAKAIQVRVPGRDELLWIPRGQVREGSEVREDGDHGTLVISGWIAGEKGLGTDAPRAPNVADDVRQRRMWDREEAASDPADPDLDDDLPF